MPRVYSPVSEIDTHIVLPVATQITHKIVNELHYQYILGDRIYIDTGWTATMNHRINHVFINRQNLLKVTVETLHPSNMTWDFTSFRYPTGHMIQTPHIQDIFPDLLVDKQGRITLKEMILPMCINLNGTMMFKNRDQAYEFQSLMYRRFSPGMVFTEVISYDYPIPNDILAMIYSLYKLRKFDRQPLKFKEWMDICSSKMCNFDINRTATSSELVVKKVLINPLVTINHTEDKPVENKRNKAVTQYDCNFTVNIQFQRPDMLTLEYPCVIDNELVPSNMIVTPKEDNPIESLDAPYPLKILEAQMRQTSVKGVEPYCIQCPYYDTWQTPYTPLRARSYKPMFIAMFLLEELPEEEKTEENKNNKYRDKIVIDLDNDLGDGYELHPKVKKMLKIQKHESFFRDCVFNISVFVDDHIVGFENLQIDENLKVTIPVSQDIHKERRIVISEISDLRYLNDKWYPYIKGDDFFIVDKETDIHDKIFDNDDWTDRYGGTENATYSALRRFKNTIFTRNKTRRNKQNTTR